jgi:aspartate/methionine/tyrosine aminotransferase
MKPLSHLTETFTESVIREMTRVCTEARGINLSQGMPEFDPPPEVKRAAVKAINSQQNQYPVTFGEPELREAISKKAKWYNTLRVDPAEEVTVTCGATEAMMATLRAVINPGDEIVIFDPFYENYGPDGILSGATPRFVPLEHPSWSFDEERLTKAVGPRTKAIIVNTPNNPTGKVFSRKELGVIRDLCIDHDLYAVTDEIYEHILYDGKTHVSLGSLPGMADRTVTINALSKTYNATGWRVGWALAEKKISKRIRKVHDFLTVGAPTPFQHAGAVALEMPKSYYEDLASKYVQRRDFLHAKLVQAGFEAPSPSGAYYIIADAARLMKALGAKNDVDFALKFLKEVGIATVPGSSFRADKKAGRTHVRFTFCKQWPTLRAAGAKLDAFARSNGRR